MRPRETKGDAIFSPPNKYPVKAHYVGTREKDGGREWKR